MQEILLEVSLLLSIDKKLVENIMRIQKLAIIKLKDCLQDLLNKI